MPHHLNRYFAFDLCGIALASLYIYEKKLINIDKLRLSDGQFFDSRGIEVWI